MNYICFDIGGTKIKYGILDSNYTIIEKHTTDTNANLGGVHVINTVINLIKDYKLKYELAGVAISTSGVVDQNTGTILYANDVMPNYTGLNVSKMIYDATNLLTSVENDVNSFALSHTLSVKEDFLMVAVGTGIGGAIVINNQVYHGKTNSGGEFGTMIIDNNTKFEALASVSALVRNAKRLGLDVNSGLEVFDLYDSGNCAAKTAVDDFYKNLATGIINLSYIFNFPKIILGGGITNRKEFLSELTKKIKELADPAYHKSEIIISPNTNDGGMIGALVHHKQLYKLK